MNMKQREEESIRSYLDHFNVAILEVYNLDQLIVMATLKDGLLKNGLHYSLIFAILWRRPILETSLIR